MDFGIKVSADESDALEAAAEDLLLSTTYPFAKIDSSNDTSFRNILLSFNQDVPQPSGVGTDLYRDTVVYSFEHGYDYAPSYWSLIQVVVPPSSVTFSQERFQDTGVIGGITAFDSASLTVKVDDERVYLVVTKYKDTAFGGGNVNLVPCTLRVRLFVFVEELEDQ